jgi:hypothetical protein
MLRRKEKMPDKHEPDPQFLNKLEWQLAGELRRLNRRGGPHPVSIRVLKIAALMLLSVGLGAGAMEASQQIQESWRTELLEVRTEIQLEIARQRVEAQREALEETREEVEQGLRHTDELMQEEQQIAQAQSLVDIMELRLEEIRESGREPLGELSSPLVGDRDFVRERIEVQMRVAQVNIRTMQRQVERARSRNEAGVTDDADLQGWNLAAREAELEMDRLAEQLETRQAYVRGEITAVEAELRVLQLEIQNRIVLLNLQLELYVSELERFRAMEEAGLVTPSRTRRVRMFNSDIEGQLRLAETELEIVQRELERRGESG